MYIIFLEGIMKFNSFAYIFVLPGFNAESENMTIEKNGFRFKAVGVDMGNKEEAIAAAKSLRDEGYQMIELCGGFGPEWAYKISKALGDDTPVGGVYYGPASRKTLVDLLT